MTKSLLKIIPLISLLAVLQETVSAQQQKCKLFLYSEFDNYSLFIDDKLIGENIKEVDSVDCTEHYIKITYQNITIFSELLKFNENETKKF